MRFPHSLLLQKNVQAVDGSQVPRVDEYNQPIEAAPSSIPFRGWLQPRSAVEIRQANEAGVTIQTHILFAPAKLPVGSADRVMWDIPGDTRLYQVEAGSNDAAGVGHHLEINLRQVAAGEA